MNKTKRIFYLIAATVFCVMASGCSQREELGNVAVITGFFLDYQPEKKEYHLLAEMADFSDYEKNSSLSAKWLEANGNSLKNAFSGLQKNAPKELCFSHADILLFGKNIPKNTLLLEELMKESVINRDLVLALTDISSEEVKREAASPVCKTAMEKLKKEKAINNAKLYQLYQKKEAFRLLPEVSPTKNTTLNQS